MTSSDSTVNLTAATSDADADVNVIDSENTKGNEKGNKFIYAFNTFFAEYILHLKKTSPEIKNALKMNYRSIKNISSDTQHLSWLRENIDLDSLRKAYDAYSSGETSDVSFDTLMVAKGVHAGMLIDTSSETEPSADDKPKTDAQKGSFLQILSQLCMLSALNYLFMETQGIDQNENFSNDEKNEALKQLENLLSKTLYIISALQKGDHDAKDELLAEILDDDLVKYFEIISQCEAELQLMLEENENASKNEKETEKDQGQGKGLDQFTEMLDRFKDSKLGKLASELTEEIDVSKLNIENPAEMLNFANITNQDSAIGSIVQKMTNKIQSGQIKYDELLGEAFGMFKGLDLGALQNNPLFSNLAGQMGNPMGGSSPTPPASSGSGTSSAKPHLSARDRLRRRLAEKNNNNH